jgi:hypothetical protein
MVFFLSGLLSHITAFDVELQRLEKKIALLGREVTT